ncbi:MAG TPA: ATP-binding protein [Bryobacteraceae bacterium]|nr:ATP-binding protein [Bryobacteraceae bacterium]
MTRLDNYLAYAETNRMTMFLIASALIALIAWVDWLLPDISIGFLYLLPILLCAAALSNVQILMMAILCGYFREAFDPLEWAPGAAGRLVVASAGFAMTGFFVAELNQRRRLLMAHLKEREEQIRLRQEAEMRVRVLIETSPLAILTLDDTGHVQLANESARRLLGFESEPLQGEEITPYLPILSRLMQSHHTGTNIRTNVECKGHRHDGEVFLAHVWLSTYRTSGGTGLAAVIWDASENLRDREGAGLDSMMATSRVLIGALSHEIRNLASAAALAHGALAPVDNLPDNAHYQALGSLITGLEKIASSGLRVASNREAAVADLGTLLDEARIVIEPSLREAGIDVSWQIASDLPLVQADHHSLLQVFVNLARNSERALSQAEHREVTISAQVENDLVIVRFRDTGPGVAHPEELFRPFQPGAHSFGLGLYISRAILRAHGGGLRHEAGQPGCCFAVELWPVESSGEG